MPHVSSLLGGPLVLDGAEDPGAVPANGSLLPDVTLRALDACLGVPGLPQSATGQTALSMLTIPLVLGWLA